MNQIQLTAPLSLSEKAAMTAAMRIAKSKFISSLHTIAQFLSKNKEI